jgi:hypothetical protein
VAVKACAPVPNNICVTPILEASAGLLAKEGDRLTGAAIVAADLAAGSPMNETL